jgi:hypothetical protein
MTSSSCEHAHVIEKRRISRRLAASCARYRDSGQRDPESDRPSATGRRRISVALVLVTSMYVLAAGGAQAFAATGSLVQLSSTYSMTFDNLTLNTQAAGTLSGIKEDQYGNLSGQMTVNPPLYGTGSFTGTASSTTINFVVTGTGGVYTATMNAQGTLTGTYTYPGQQGTWQAIPTPDTSAPSVSWTSPVANGGTSTVSSGTVTLEASASDNIGVARVTFIRWDAVAARWVTLATVSTSPWRTTVAVSSLNGGYNQINVQAWDAAGNASASPYIWLYRPDTSAPSVSWTSPVGNGATFNVSSGTVTLAASASDNIGVARVKFTRWDTVKGTWVDVATVSSAPWQTTVNVATLNSGYNQINVQAWDAAGNPSTSPYIWLNLLHAHGYGFANSQISAKAQSYAVGSHGGTCKVWAANVVNAVLAANGITAQIGGYGSPGGAYYGAYQNAGGVLVSASDAQPGDLVQIIVASQKNSDYPTGTLHTAIIVGLTSTPGTFLLRDSNWNSPDMKVFQHTLDPVSWATANGATAYFWRFGTVTG